MGMLILGLVLLVGGHLVLAIPGVRAALVSRMGALPYMGAYSIVAVAGLTLIFIGHGGDTPYVALWTPPSWSYWLPVLVMPVAFYLVISGYTQRNPTAIGMPGLGGAEPTGVLTITRHPTMWGILLWALAHIPANGDLASLLLFGGIGLLALLGPIGIDAKKAAAGDPDWPDFAARTSNLPFLALIQGRARWRLRDLRWPVALAAIAASGIVAHFHEAIFGVAALPA